MVYMCLNCGEIYKDNDFKYCPKISCYGKMIRVDELMAPIIAELNRKNWHTLYSCSGHMWDKDTICCPYIAFDIEKQNAEQFLTIFADLPQPWFIDYNKETLLPYCIRARITSSNDIDKYNKICDANNKLFAFVKSMSELDEQSSSNLQNC